MRNFSECQSQKPFNIIVAWCVTCQNGGFGRFNIQCYAILQSNQGLSKYVLNPNLKSFVTISEPAWAASAYESSKIS